MAPPIMGETVFLAEAGLKPQQSKHIDDEYKTNLRKPPTKDDFNVQVQKSLVDIKPQETNIAKKPYERELVWRNIIAFVYLHLAALYGLYLALTDCKWSTILFAIFTANLGGFGVTGGAHRLWAHRSYKAKWPLRLILIFAQTIAFQNSIYEWVRDHRVHHKFTDTDADPHNSKRGFFFSHIGWLVCKKHEDVKIKGKTIDMSDLEADPIVMFQYRHYMKLVPICCFLLPTLIPYYFFGENFSTAYYFSGIFRYAFTLNATWLVNSAAHIWGDKPYDKTISPTQSLWVSFCTNGEGFHNYHHTFPWDYKAAELAGYYGNSTTAAIDMFSRIGWAYDLKTVPQDMIKARIIRTGDGTHRLSRQQPKHETKTATNGTADDHSHENMVWGWGDPDMEEDEIKNADISYKQE